MKSLTLLGLASSFSLLALASCGPTSNYDPTNFLPSGTSENPYQIVKEPITLTIFAPHSAGNPEYETLKMFKQLSKLTNLNFNFVTPDTSAYTSVRSAVWSSGSIPDLFLFNNAVSEQVQFMENKYDAYIPFNDDAYSYSAGGQTISVGNLITNYMPNYQKGLANNFGIDKTKEDATKIATLSDGKMYAALSVKDVARDLTFKMFINQKWIDNLNANYSLGLPNAQDIKTIEQYLTVLRAFRDYDANDNGDPSDEIPVTSKSMEYLRNFILASYGYVSQGAEIRSDWSTFDYVPYTAAYREYLKFAHTLYAEKLLQNSTFSLTTDSQLAKYGVKDQLGSFVGAAAYIITGYDYESQYTTFGPLTSSFYTGSPVQLGLGSLIPDGACIPSKTLYPREVARLLDLMYSDVGAQLISYGIEGEDWTWDDEAKTSWTFHVPSTWTGNQEQYRATITPNVNSGSALYWSNAFVGKMNDPIIKSLNTMSERYLPYLKVPEPYEIKMTSSEYADITKIKAALDPQLQYLEASYIRGDDGSDPSSESSWNSFVSQLKGHQADALLADYNAALARYQGK